MRMLSRYYNLKFYLGAIPFTKLILAGIEHPFVRVFGKGRGGRIVAVNWSITNRCNQRCHMCHSFEYTKNLNNEMPFEKIKKFLEENRRNFFTILFTGGEPFLREDICDIIDVAKASRLSCGVCTNGTLLDPNKINRINKSRLDFIIFSIHGPRDIHDDIVGEEGNFDTTMSNLAEFLRVNSRTKAMINCSITEKNFDRLKDLVKIARHFKIPLRYEHLNYMSPDNLPACNEEWRERMKDMPDCKVVTYNTLPKIDAANTDRIYENMEYISRNNPDVFFKPNLDHNDLRKWYLDQDIGRACHYAWNSLHLTPGGDVLPCHFLDLKMGNINENPLLEIWNSDKYMKFRRELKKGIFIGCRHCNKL